jgi:pimeloyl-ACP methyl ester carboxylesterase
MSPRSIRRFIAPLLACGVTLLGGCAGTAHKEPPAAEIGTIDISPDIQLRRMVVRGEQPQGTVLLLHGFPETVYAWKSIALDLGKDHEVHAFDWPGFGLSSRPSADAFSYAPRDYARVLKAYIERANIDKSRLTIYATDIGALPALLLALDEPTIARRIIVGDFAPFDRPQYMQATLQSLKSKPSADATRSAMNKSRDEIVENAYRRGFSKDEQFDVAADFKEDMRQGWSQHGITSADAFYHYYSFFTRDQQFFEQNVSRLKTPVSVVWGERDFYIKKEMGAELADKAGLQLRVLPGIGHYPHLQSPGTTVEEIRAATR